MLDHDPIGLFREWRQEALASTDDPAAGAMILATATPQGRPSARAVILRKVDERGFVFYTDSGSRKGAELAANPYAALVFLWPQRQVRAEGEVMAVPGDEADTDWLERPRDHQLATWACRQSEPIAEPADIERGMEEAARRFPEGAVPRPLYWGGYRLVPTVMEFWQARANRLHDRVEYRQEGWDWAVRRLAP
ncbi:MAG: pyridoxamine 5'-phosphate oxidase [Actinomycetota bacterium]|nr:pyridoxamine 5'-phosphate oxidase [Actinomycetota bacterium]